MRTVAIYPGRFHVFHRGHMAVYDHLVKQFGQENVYVATSAKQNATDSPFNYSDKVAMMTKMGVPAGRIIQVTNPYKIDEIISLLGLDPATDHLVYALGAKDAERFKYTPDSALQLLSQTKKMKPVGKHAYVEVVPTIQFNVLGQKVADASKIRELYRSGNDNDRMQLISDLYGITDPELKAVFDERLGVNDPGEGIIHGQERVYAGENPVSIMKETRLAKLQQNIQYLREQIQILRASQDYIDERRPRKK